MYDILVSVCVISYNSSKFITETLDSIKAQTYPSLELIISDDCSTDNTISVCKEWIRKNSDRFVRTQIVELKRNKGVANNINHAIAATRGEWLKTIAGDDILLPNCIADNMDYVMNHDHLGFVLSKCQLFFNDDDGNRTLMDYYLPHKNDIKYYSMSSEEQYKCLLNYCFSPSVSLFQSREFAVEHPLPEEYPFCEDYPHWLHLTKAGIKLTYFDKTTVLYRFGDSLSNCNDKRRFINEKFHRSMIAFFYAERLCALNEVSPSIADRQRKEFFLGDVALFLLKNKRNIFTRTILYAFKLMLNTKRIC